MRRLAPALVLLLAACSAPDEPPHVTWGDYPTNVHQAVRDDVKARDCDGMQRLFDGTKSADLLDYLDWQMKKAGCY